MKHFITVVVLLMLAGVASNVDAQVTIQDTGTGGNSTFSSLPGSGCIIGNCDGPNPIYTGDPTVTASSLPDSIPSDASDDGFKWVHSMLNQQQHDIDHLFDNGFDAKVLGPVGALAFRAMNILCPPPIYCILAVGELGNPGGPNGGIPEPPGGESAWKSKVGEAMAKIDTLWTKTRADLGVARAPGQEGEMWQDLNGKHFIETLMDLASSHGPNSDAAGHVLVDFVDANGSRTIEQVISGNDQMADFMRGKYERTGNAKWILGIDVPMRPGPDGATPGLRYNRFPKRFMR